MAMPCPEERAEWAKQRAQWDLVVLETTGGLTRSSFNAITYKHN